jgi:hypothetical protein
MDPHTEPEPTPRWRYAVPYLVMIALVALAMVFVNVYL